MNLRSIFASIVTRLLLLALCIVTLGAVARYYALSHFLREDLSSVVQNQQMALASYVARDLDFKIEQRQALLRRLASTLPAALLQRPAELQAWLRLHCDFQCPFSQGLFVVTQEGRAIADYPPLPGRVGSDFSDRDYISAALSAPARLDRIVIGRPVIGRASKTGTAHGRGLAVARWPPARRVGRHHRAGRAGLHGFAAGFPHRQAE